MNDYWYRTKSIRLMRALSSHDITIIVVGVCAGITATVSIFWPIIATIQRFEFQAAPEMNVVVKIIITITALTSVALSFKSLLQADRKKVCWCIMLGMSLLALMLGILAIYSF